MLTHLTLRFRFLRQYRGRLTRARAVPEETIEDMQEISAYIGRCAT